MIAWLSNLLQHAADWRLTRRMLDTFLRCGTRVASPSTAEAIRRSQARVLRGLVHCAQHTRFGKDHDFGRIRTVADFRRVTPLRTPQDHYNRYWEPVFPWLNQATWPDTQRILESPHEQVPFLPLTNAFAGRAAEVWGAGLAQVLGAFPRQNLLAGRLLGLVDGLAEPLACVAWSRLPWTVRPYLQVRQAGQLEPSDFREPTTLLLGSADQMLALVRRLRDQTGHDRLTDQWPDLLGTLILRGPTETVIPEIRQALDRRVVALEVVVSAEGVFAVEDLRHGGLRLLPEAGVFYELVSTNDRFCDSPSRLGLEEAQPGAHYELVTTTPTGLWACRTGLAVTFDATRAVTFSRLPVPPVVVAAPPVEAPPLQLAVKPPRSRSLPGQQVPGLLRTLWGAAGGR